MTHPVSAPLSRREREIMEIVYRLGEATASDVTSALPDKPSYDTIRVTLGILERKGHVKHRRDGRRYVFTPTVPADRASRAAMRSLLRTFYRGKPSAAILTMLDESSARLSKEELDEIAEWIERERSKGS